MYHLVVIGAYNHDITGVIVLAIGESVDVMSFTDIIIERCEGIFPADLTLARIKLFQIMNNRSSNNSMRVWADPDCKVRVWIGSVDNMFIIFLRQIRRYFLA